MMVAGTAHAATTPPVAPTVTSSHAASPAACHVFVIALRVPHDRANARRLGAPDARSAASTTGRGAPPAARGRRGPAQTPLTMRTATGLYRIITDDLGSVRLVIDPVTNTILQRLSYDEFGRVVEDTNPGFQPFGYAGGLYDADTGFVHFGARDYDPQVGRWTTKDPILLAGGFNLYVYVGNDPINATDVSGLLKGVPDWLLWLDDHGVLQGAGDFSAGVASALTFGLSDKLIGATGLGKYGSKCSGAYFGGHVGGMAIAFLGGSWAGAAESATVEGAQAAEGLGLNVATNGGRIAVTAAGDAAAIAEVEVANGTLTVTNIARAGLPPGSGAQMLAAALEEGGVASGQRVVFEGIMNAPTLNTYLSGGAASSSLLGRVGANALGQLGLSASSAEFQMVDGWLNLTMVVR